MVIESLALWRRQSCYTGSSTTQVSLDVIGRLYPQCSCRYVLEVNASRPFDDSAEYGNMLIDGVNRRGVENYGKEGHLDYLGRVSGPTYPPR